MAFNLTGVDQELFLIGNTIANIGLFVITALPMIILCGVCVLALFFAKDINWPIRVLIINILSAEACPWLGLTLRFLAYAPRAKLRGALVICKVVLNFTITGATQKFLATALYAIMVFIFVHYGVKKLKWKIIIPCIALSWLYSILYGMVVYFNSFGLFESSGFCDSNPGLLFRITLYIGIVISVSLLCTTIVFGIMTYVYIKRNTLESNVEVKKAVAKNLIYLSFAVIFSFIFNMVPATFPFIRAAFEDKGLLSLIVITYILRVFIPSALTPIAAMITLKPIRLNEAGNREMLWLLQAK